MLKIIRKEWPEISLFKKPKISLRVEANTEWIFDVIKVHTHCHILVNAKIYLTDSPSVVSTFSFC